MIGQVIGKTMGNGFAGSYSRQPDMIIDSVPAGSSIGFGDPVTYDSNGKAVTIPAHLLTASTFAASSFVGVASREVKSAMDYLDQNKGSYALNEIAAIMKRGHVNVVCQRGTAELNGDVYVRVAENASYPTAKVGGFEAASDTTNSVKLTNAKWAGGADGNKVAELAILSQINA